MSTEVHRILCEVTWAPLTEERLPIVKPTAAYHRESFAPCMWEFISLFGRSIFSLTRFATISPDGKQRRGRRWSTLA